MRKRLITPSPQDAPFLDEGWLDLDGAAMVEVTSEDKQYPVESALVSGEMRGWRAAGSGSQTLRLIFDKPQRLKRIALVFEETEIERTQEFVLRWSSDGGRSFREIVRQQWNFSPWAGPDAAIACRASGCRGQAQPRWLFIRTERTQPAVTRVSRNCIYLSRFIN